jgi:hypothetical protein
MKYFSRFVLVSAVLFTILALLNGKSHGTYAHDRDLAEIELSSVQPGVLSLLSNDPPVPKVCNIPSGHSGLPVNPELEYEFYLLSRTSLKISWINSGFINRMPELTGRTGQWVHSEIPGAEEWPS